jgi:hypothetical protein
MKRTLLALALVAAGTAAFAEGGTYEYPTTVNSALTRGEVQADASRTLRAGPIVTGEAQDVASPVRSTVSRAQVIAEAREAQRLGLTIGGEASAEATPAQLRSIQLAGERAIAPRMAGTVR